MASARADLRARVTARVLELLAGGRTVLVVGGPAMGKSELVARARAVRPATRTVDEPAADEVEGMLAERHASGHLITLGIAHHGTARRLTRRLGAAFVPLVNVPRSWLRETAAGAGCAVADPTADAAWRASAGHVHLASACDAGPEALQRARDELTTRWRSALAGRAAERRVLSILAGDQPGGSSTATSTELHGPAARYARLLEEVSGNPKPELDWLRSAGLVTRLMDGDAAGLTLVPGAADALLERPAGDDAQRVP